MNDVRHIDLAALPADKDEWDVDELAAMEREYTRLEVLRRIKLRLRVDSDPELQAMTIAYYRSNPMDPERCIRWINDWVWSVNPRNFRHNIPARVPVRLYGFQEDAVRQIFEWVDKGENGLFEKTRSMGATVVIAAGVFMFWWLFLDDFQGGVGSRKLDLVDKKGDPDCIFEKLRNTLRNLPRWMQPPGFRSRDHDKVATLVNPSSGAAITGEGGPNIGRGGRKTCYLVDEAASVEHQESAENALSETADTVIWNTTPKGRGNHVAKMRFSGNVPVFTMHWRSHPFRNEAWYRRLCEKFAHNPVLIAQELDIDWSASVDRVVIPAIWVQAAVNYADCKGVGGERRAGYDVALGGGDESGYIARCGPEVINTEFWVGDSNTDANAYASRVITLALNDEVEALLYDVVGVGSAVAGEARHREEAIPDGQSLGVRVVPVNGAERASDRHHDFAPKHPGNEVFANRRAELHWLLRRRFEKTWQRRQFIEHGDAEKGHEWPVEECICIPNDPTLIAQLSVATWTPKGDGRIAVASKDDMRGDGIKSPDRADTLMYTFADEGASVWLWG